MLVGMSTNEPTEEQLRAAYEEEIKRIRVEQVLLEQVVTLVNLGMRRTGLMAGTESERDPEQVHLAIESIRALLPLVEPTAADQIGPIRQALSQLQLAYVQISGGSAAAAEGEAAGRPPTQPPASGQTGAQQAPRKPPSSSRLWIPGQ